MNDQQIKADIPVEDLHRLQQKSLELLLYFKKICDENHLLFYFCGGCCIGTVRNGGFVPWDDDVDVFMPREDYESLAQVWAEKADTQRYGYARTGRNMFTRLLFTTISDNNTTFIKTRQCDLNIDHGIRLDILPIDGCPDSRIQRKIQIAWALLYSMFNIEEPPTSKGKGLETIGRILLAIVPKKLHCAVWRLAERRMSRFPIRKCHKVTELCAWYHYMVNEYPAEAFRSAVYKKFEGYDMPIPAGYDAYLSMAFGDYMQLPPLECRVAKHDVVFYDLDHSFKLYNGKYYGEGHNHT